jgi:hypothetical protein
VNDASVHFHLGAEGRLPMACGAMAPVEVVAAAGNAEGGRRPRTDRAGPKGLELGRLRKKS